MLHKSKNPLPCKNHTWFAWFTHGSGFFDLHVCKMCDTNQMPRAFAWLEPGYPQLQLCIFPGLYVCKDFSHWLKQTNQSSWLRFQKVPYSNLCCLSYSVVSHLKLAHFSKFVPLPAFPSCKQTMQSFNLHFLNFSAGSSFETCTADQQKPPTQANLAPFSAWVGPPITKMVPLAANRPTRSPVSQLFIFSRFLAPQICV